MPKHVQKCVDLRLLTADFLYVSEVTLEAGKGRGGGGGGGGGARRSWPGGVKNRKK